MRIYLTAGSLPELSSLPVGKRQAIWHRCHPKAWRHWQTWAALSVSLAFYAVGFYFGVFAQSQASYSWSLGSAGLFLLLIGSAGFLPVHIAITRRYIRQELDRDENVT